MSSRTRVNAPAPGRENRRVAEPVVITDPGDPRVADFRDLKAGDRPAGAPRGTAPVIVEGVPAVERLLGNAASKVSMSSTKSATGHLLGAAGAIEAIFAILAIRDNVVPPTINLDNPSVQTAIDLVPHTSRKRDVNVALSNSFGFGGTNASVIVQRVIN